MSKRKCQKDIDQLVEAIEKAADSMNIAMNKLKEYIDPGDKDDEKFENRAIATKNAIETFDFDRVEKVMSILDWKWAEGAQNGTFGVPNKERLVGEVKRLIDSAWKELDLSGYCKFDSQNGNYKEMTIGTGGFEIDVWEDDYESCVMIKFILTESAGNSNYGEVDESCTGNG